MSQTYNREKLSVAVDALVSSNQGIRERLGTACLSIHMLQPNDFLEVEQQKYKSLFDKLNSVEPIGDEGSFQATLNAMTIEEAGERAREILHLYIQVELLTHGQ
jgi:hypothetical protein